ncbi:MAG: CBS domain-containing protein [Planctomycetes bacterium]|nr:CBS domain-containing protein [Planctomycetota bacterium]
MPQPKLFDLCAEDVMQRKIVTLGAGDSLPAAERTLTEAGISGAPVLDDHDRVLGVVSMTDLLRHRAEDDDIPDDAEAEVFDDSIDETEQVAFFRPEAGACVGDVMTQEIVSVPPSMPLAKIAERMVSTHVHRVLVLERGRLIGLISTMDLLEKVARGR